MPQETIPLIWADLSLIDIVITLFGDHIWAGPISPSLSSLVHGDLIQFR